MKKVRPVLLAVLLVIFVSHRGLAQDDVDSTNDLTYKENKSELVRKKFVPSVEIPPGMEMLNTRGVYVIVPQGLKIEKKGDIMIMEGPNEFAARSFKDMNERFEKVEASQRDLQKEVDDLRKKISDLENG